MRSYLLQPYPHTDRKGLKTQLRAAFLVSIGVLFSLGVFQPFGLSEWKGADLWQTIAGYVLICFVVTTANAVWPVIFPAFFKEDNWTVWKEISWLAWNIFSVGLANTAYSNLTDVAHVQVSEMLWITFLVAVLPVSLMVSINYVYHLKKNLTLAGDLNNDLHYYQQQHPLTNTASLVTPHQPVAILFLPSDEKSGGLQIAAEALVLLKADDNYVEVHYFTGKCLQKTLLRNSLKNIEQQLAGFPQFFRCHRSYIVNLDQAENIIGNAQGAKLTFRHTALQAPVSRGLIKALKERMQGS